MVVMDRTLEFSLLYWRMEKERTVSNPYLWGMRGEVKPTIFGGLEVGFFRMMQLGGEGRPEGFSTWVDAFLESRQLRSKYWK